MFEKRFYFSLLLLTFFLLLLGGLVHNTGSSLACPDWPLCYGKVFPRMEGGILVEHSHRLLASLVGLMTVLSVLIMRRKSNLLKYPKLLKWSYLSLLMVVLQGLLGGLTVIYKLPTIVSTSHLALSMLFFCMVAFLHHSTGKSSVALISEIALKRGTSRFVLYSLMAVYAQMVLGAFMRHSGAGAACGLGWDASIKCADFSLVKELVWWPHMPMAMLHMFHRLLGFAVVLFVSASTLKVVFQLVSLKKTGPLTQAAIKAKNNLLLFSVLPMVLVIFQAVLGIMVIGKFLGVLPTTAHLGLAGLLLLSLWKLYLSLTSGPIREVISKENSQPGKVWAYFLDLCDLTKPRLSALVLMTFMVGMLLAPGKIPFYRLILINLYMAMIVAGSCVLNCYKEREIDKKMLRTQNRPLPAGRLSSKVALGMGLGLLAISIPGLLSVSNFLTCVLGTFAMLSYIFWYTPMKRKGPTALFIGAIPGALPPVMGWTSVTGSMNVIALSLFLILFFWQLSHFLAISIYHFNDYRAAEIKVLPNMRGIPFTKRSILFFTTILILISFLPSMFGGMGINYMMISGLAGILFLGLAVQGVFLGNSFEKNKIWARRFFMASLFYLPTLFGAMIFF